MPDRRPQATFVRRIRRKLWHQDPNCHWCHRPTILPEDLLRRYVPLDDLYQLRMEDQITPLINQLRQTVPEFRTAWESDLATVDHLVEHALGGTYDETNLVIACYPCNEARGQKFSRSLDVAQSA